MTPACPFTVAQNAASRVNGGCRDSCSREHQRRRICCNGPGQPPETPVMLQKVRGGTSRRALSNGATLERNALTVVEISPETGWGSVNASLEHPSPHAGLTDACGARTLCANKIRQRYPSGLPRQLLLPGSIRPDLFAPLPLFFPYLETNFSSFPLFHPNVGLTLAFANHS